VATVHVRWVLPWEVVDHGIMHSVYFSDPNAVRELAAGGLERIPSTRLVGGFTQQRDDWCARAG
jgi:hypothetical protein